MKEQNQLNNDTLKKHPLLADMYADAYFPKNCVDKVKSVLIEVCFEIEKNNPQNLEMLYLITHKATEQINALEDYFYKHDSEIETAARETIAMDFEFIATTYGFQADIEMLIAPREW